MALAGTTIIEVQTGGDDTNNGGMFDPGQTAGMFTDGAATLATGNAPVFTSASYNFVAGDVGAWVYIASGTNWTPGWYKIASVAANAATLNATIGAAVAKDPQLPNTVAGCATTASPTSATWTIDYSQQAAAQFTYTDLASVGAGLTVSSAAKPFAKQQVGNSLVITGGTNFTAGRWVIASVAAGVATLVGPANVTTGAGVSGTGGQGGAFATPGKAASVVEQNNKIWIKSGTYTVTTASTNVSNGCINATKGGGAVAGQVAKWEGYGSIRGDLGTKPVLQASGISTFTLFSMANDIQIVRNIEFDGASLTSSRGISCGSVYSNIERCKIKNCTNNGVLMSTNVSVLFDSDITGCSTQPAVSMTGVGSAAMYNRVYSNTVTGINANGDNRKIIGNLVYSNSGASSDGINAAAGWVEGNTCYGNGRDGIRASAVGYLLGVMNNVAYGNGGTDLNMIGGVEAVVPYRNNAYGTISTNIVNSARNVALSGDPFTNSGTGDFSLNNTAGRGAACRAAGIQGTFPGALTTGYRDIGAAQHQDSGDTTTIEVNTVLANIGYGRNAVGY